MLPWQPYCDEKSRQFPQIFLISCCHGNRIVCTATNHTHTHTNSRMKIHPQEINSEKFFYFHLQVTHAASRLTSESRFPSTRNPAPAPRDNAATDSEHPQLVLCSFCVWNIYFTRFLFANASEDIILQWNDFFLFHINYTRVYAQMMRNPEKFQIFSWFQVAMATVLCTQPRITHTRTQRLLNVFVFIQRTDSSSSSSSRVARAAESRARAGKEQCSLKIASARCMNTSSRRITWLMMRNPENLHPKLRIHEAKLVHPHNLTPNPLKVHPTLSKSTQPNIRNPQDSHPDRIKISPPIAIKYQKFERFTLESCLDFTPIGIKYNNIERS